MEAFSLRAPGYRDIFIVTKPKFKIGFELEGVLRDTATIVSEFDRGLRNIDPDIDRGEDGSVEGYFRRKGSWEYEGTCDGLGVEIRTPPHMIELGTERFGRILDYLNEWSERGEFKTNKTCGLHVNLSEGLMVATHDRFVEFYANLISVFPERQILKMFSRSNNTYCHPLFAYQDSDGDWKADYGDARQSDVRSLINAIGNRSIGCGKYHTAAIHSQPGNLNYFPDNRRIEFRCLGNLNYHKKVDKINEALDIIRLSATEAFFRVSDKLEGLDPQESVTPQRIACAA